MTGVSSYQGAFTENELQLGLEKLKSVCEQRTS